MAKINGVVLSKANIAFLKSVQENDRKKRGEAVDAKIAKIKNDGVMVVSTKPAKTKLSHAQRKARKVAKDKAFGNTIKDNSGFHAGIKR